VRRPAGVTTVELCVAAGLALMLVSAGYAGVRVLRCGEASTDREASCTLVQAQLMEQLLEDLRSSTAVTVETTGRFRIERHRLTAAGLERRDVTWRRTSDTVVERAEGGRTHRFPFDGVLDPAHPAVELRLERSDDALFVP
jgi:hypothetical protein